MSRGVRHFWICAMAAAMPLLAAQNSFALTREQQMWCEGKEDASSDLRITSCTAVIEQTRANKKKSEALTNRGKAYRAKGDNDHAIHDFDEALKIDGKDAERSTIAASRCAIAARPIARGRGSRR